MNKLQKIIVKLFKIPVFQGTPPVTVFYNFKPITLGASFVLHPAERDLIIEGLIGEDAIRERLLKTMEEELIHYLEFECEKNPLLCSVTYRGKLRILLPESQSYENKRKEKTDG